MDLFYSSQKKEIELCTQGCAWEKFASWSFTYHDDLCEEGQPPSVDPLEWLAIKLFVLLRQVFDFKLNIYEVPIFRENMDPFILSGKYSDGTIKKLKIPSKKIFDINNCEHLRGENNDIGYDQDLSFKDYPYRQPVKMRNNVIELSANKHMFLSHRSINEKILDHVYSKHDYPVAQGPAVPPINEVS